MTRILLIGNYPADGQHSMLRYAAWLQAMLRENGFVADLLQPPVRLGKLLSPGHSAHKWLGYVDKFLLFPFTLFSRAAVYDIIHVCDHSNAPYYLFARNTPVAVTCHDLIAIRGMLGEFEQQRPRWSGRLLQKWILSSLKQIRLVCCVSESTRQDVERLVPMADRLCRTIPNPVIGFSPMPVDDADRELQNAGVSLDVPFLLCVGSNIWYKNRTGTVRLFAEMLKQERFMDMHLVCAGANFSPELRSVITGLKIGSKVKEIISPTPTLLLALYNRAAALLFVSLYEGFGWPIVEAQACGCPVITSNREPMKSIAGEPALTVDPVRPVEAARLIGDRWSWILAQTDASIDNAARFSEGQARSDYLAFYRHAVGNKLL